MTHRQPWHTHTYTHTQCLVTLYYQILDTDVLILWTGESESDVTHCDRHCASVYVTLVSVHIILGAVWSAGWYKCDSWNENQPGCHSTLPFQEQHLSPTAAESCWFVPIIHCAASCLCSIKTGILGMDQNRILNTNCVKERQIFPATKDINQHWFACCSHHRVSILIHPARFPCIFFPPLSQ